MAESSDLPKEFDAVIVGTGLCESILAAALSRIGYSVLHLDRNYYYGSSEATFSLSGLLNYKSSHSESIRSSHEQEGLKGIDLKNDNGAVLFNLEYGTYDISEDEQKFYSDVLSYEARQTEIKEEGAIRLEEQATDSSQAQGDHQSGESSPDISSESNSERELPASDVDRSDQSMKPTDLKAKQEDTGTSESEPETKPDYSKVNPVIKEFCSNLSTEGDSLEKKLSLLLKKTNRFILDLAPKLLYSESEMIDLLITSDVARYLEFKTITQILTPGGDNSLQVVPCSRSDIFSTKSISMIEKRILMKLLTFCMDYKNHPEQYQDYIDKPFREFLKSQKLTPNLMDYVAHAIAMVSDSATTLQGLQKTEKFLKSVGKYGSSPFLWPLYGGEMNQAFCRMCAVFGGIYILGQTVVRMHIDEESNKVTSILLSTGQIIRCKWLVLNPCYIETGEDKSCNVSRVVLVTDGSLSSSRKEETVLMSYPAVDGVTDPVTILELGPGSCVCPRDPPNLRIVHITMKSIKNTAKEDLEVYVNKLFSTGSNSEKPRLLFSCYFNQKDYGIPPDMKEQHLDNVYIASGPDSDINPDNSVTKARQIFEALCPGEDFLPRPPDPDDIIYCDDKEASKSSATQFSQESVDPSLDGKPLEDQMDSPPANPSADQPDFSSS